MNTLVVVQKQPYDVQTHVGDRKKRVYAFFINGVLVSEEVEDSQSNNWVADREFIIKRVKLLERALKCKAIFQYETAPFNGIWDVNTLTNCVVKDPRGKIFRVIFGKDAVYMVSAVNDFGIHFLEPQSLVDYLNEHKMVKVQ